MVTVTTTVPKPDKYVAGENFSRFVERFKQWITLGNMEDDNLYLLFLSFLDEKTYDKLKGVKLDADGKKDERVFCQEYLKVIYGQEDVRNLRSTLMTMGQREDESIDDYCQRLSELGLMAYENEEVREQNMVTAFLQGIFDPAMKQKLYESTAQTFAEVKTHARRIEKASEVIDMTNRTQKILGIGDSTSSVPGPSTDSRGIPQSGDRGVSGRGCYKCGSLEHFKRECPQMRAQRDTRSGGYNSQSRTTYRPAYRPGARTEPRDVGQAGRGRGFQGTGAIFCSYCGVRNHAAVDCRKLRNDTRLNRLRVSQGRPTYHRENTGRQ